MHRLMRLLAAAGLFAAVPLLAQDKAEKPAEKKADDKKPADKEPPKKEAPAPGHAQKYKPVATLVVKLTQADTKEMTIEAEAHVRSGRYGTRAERQAYTLAEDVVVRVLKLPDRLDDKNRPVPYTAEEKAKLKGNNPKLPGYHAELSALVEGQVVELELSVHRPAPGTSKKKADEEKPFVTRVVIQSDPPKMAEKEKKKK